jgi:hypothetical protein
VEVRILAGDYESLLGGVTSDDPVVRVAQPDIADVERTGKRSARRQTSRGDRSRSKGRTAMRPLDRDRAHAPPEVRREGEARADSFAGERG